MTTRVVLVGAGNVGAHLARRLAERGWPPVQVFSRNAEKAAKVARSSGAEAVSDLQKIRPDADVYLLAVHDDAIETVASQLAKTLPHNTLAAHTSGATPSAVLARHFRHYGVFYPLQTFSAGRQPEFAHIPICVFAPDAQDLALLKTLAGHVSHSVREVNDEQRATLHLAAVFVNNFVNLMYRLGSDIVQKEGIPFDALLPLIQETALKVVDGLPPADAQTGPARRGDSATMQRHLDLLNGQPHLQEMYRLLSEEILKRDV
ncbi:MAG TPA: DUF2520 domain-containing protein [Saprospiraceae bacterium]|nr:DUF2520 domain-containing protein [Saprospiraceae bacterium]